jgi:hypothetical protein
MGGIMRRNYLRLSALFTGVLVINGFGAFKSYSQQETSDTVSPTQTFTVTTGNNSGAGSLRQAITDANASPGLDTITFNISGTGIKTITITSVLPTITDPVIVDGTSQPDYSGTPLIVIHGSGTSEAMKVTAGGTTLKGLTFGNFAGATADGAVNFSTNGGNVVTACTFGIRGDNVTDRISNDALVFSGISNNRVGGSTPAERNYFGADDFNQGVLLKSGASNNRITGNWFGVAPNGNGIQQRTSIKIMDSPNNTVGGTVGVTPGGACTGECNVITGNQDQSAAVYITGGVSTGNVVIGNFVGLLADGHTPNANRVTGVRLSGAPGNRIGGTTAAERNVISANNSVSVLVDGAGANANIITGNYIGTDSTGMNRSTTLGTGISLNTGSANSIVGGTLNTTLGGPCTGQCNVISGNGNNGTASGISILNSTGNVIDGNYIGLNAAGTAAILNGRKPDGSIFQGRAIVMFNANGNTIGSRIVGPGEGSSAGPAIPTVVYCYQDPKTKDYILVDSVALIYTAKHCASGTPVSGRVNSIPTGFISVQSDPNYMNAVLGDAEVSGSATLQYRKEDGSEGSITGQQTTDTCTCGEGGVQNIAGTIELSGQGGSSDNNLIGYMQMEKDVGGNDLPDLQLPKSPLLITIGNNNEVMDTDISSFRMAALTIADGINNAFHGLRIDQHMSDDPVDIAPGANGDIHITSLGSEDALYGVNVFGTADGLPSNAQVEITIYGSDDEIGTKTFTDGGLRIRAQADQMGHVRFETNFGPPEVSIITSHEYLKATVTVLLGGPSAVLLTRGNTSELSSRTAVPHPQFDWDNDGKTDIGVYRPGSGSGLSSYWYILNSSDNSALSQQFGSAGDQLVTGDYNGDRKSDYGVFRPSSGYWYTSNPTGDPAANFFSFPWGLPTDKPVNGDFDGDRRKDQAIFRPSEGTWYIHQSLGNGTLAQQWGISTDKLVPADFNGDGHTDIAVFRDGDWYVSVCPACAPINFHFGLASDIPTPADFDGDGIVDPAAFRPATGTWYIQGTTSGFFARQWGQNGDIPLDGDFDGDGRYDIGVFRPTDGNWYILQSRSGNPYAVHWGQTGDIPVPSFEAQFH